MEEHLSYLRRESSFSYSCNLCKKCCYHKRIRLTPYEIIRLARSLRITTREFILQFTEEGGTILRFRSEDGGCSLLCNDGCAVHADRPAACRIYPLGGVFQLDGGETFALLTPHPESLGVYGTPTTFKPSDTVASFLEGQEIEPYHRANRKYVRLLTHLLPLISAYADSQEESAATADINSYQEEVMRWFDIDTVVETYCSKHNIPVPADFETQVDLHIRALEEWFCISTGGQPMPTADA
jgi:Fe-S-cluster containining protein